MVFCDFCLCECFPKLIVVFTLLYWAYKFIQGPSYRKRNNINGKVVIITGCNTGIGKETALELAYRGAKVYMACRDTERCEAARLEIIAETGNKNVFNRKLDLSSFESVREFARNFLAEEDRLDILINNAGVMGVENKFANGGHELHFAVNHLGHFLLTTLLLDRLKASAPSRIVVVSSIAYAFGRIKKYDAQSFKSYKKTKAYAQSKLANVLFTIKLAEILKGTGVTVNCCHPGVVRTELMRHWKFDGFLQNIIEFLKIALLKTPRAGAQTTIRLALDPDLEKLSGGYYADCIRFPLVPWNTQQDLANWLWQYSEKVIKE